MSEADYYEAVRSKREVLKLREPLPYGTFITSGIFGAWNGRGWSKVNVPISEEVRDPAKETTFELTDEKASRTINLPKIANAKILQERIKGITKDGVEVPLKILEANAQGEVRVDKGGEAKRVAYSQNYSELPKTMAEVTEKDYEKFRQSIEKSFGDAMTKEIGDVGDELDMFVRGLAGKSPREKVIAIQEFCYTYGYYSLGEEAKDSDSFEERLSIMELRMDALRAEKPELAGKKYAGICTDFASLSAALLRRAGFVSGIASGFAPEPGSTSVTSDRAHAVSFVLWPNPDNKGGKPDLIIVDGTPSRITPKITELEAKAVEIQKELVVDAEAEMQKLEAALQTLPPEDIKKLANGELEKTLNQILSGVKESHVAVMERVLNASRYAGFDVRAMSKGSIEDELRFRRFLADEVRKEKETTHEIRTRRGEALFNLMLEFSERYAKDEGTGGKTNALNVLEKVFDIAENSLDPVEARSAAAIVTYLRARKMQ